MTFSFLRNRNMARALNGGQETGDAPVALVIPAETEALRSRPYTNVSDEVALYRVASAAGCATAMASCD
ncbi:hypothetical protein U0C82_08010 [Fulvimarina sp. 2208YS6-2-32]|uniref:Uncharacterized protein n=1 Tax=Fulvimarina uroteuthidis TaxID=3098149 RepID=A0ABU5I2V0_9HYPH|nr:hypothetical protein [Fulvimarina sp. 2208YS6-2-32]MDY8109088.1 hypothetical protein [Fulvimarina sp. 2208YS6-2-32]